MRHHVGDRQVGGVSDAGEHGHRESGHVAGQLVVVVATHAHIAAATANNHHHVEIILPLGNLPESSHDACDGLVPLQNGREQLGLESVAVLVLLQCLHEVAVPFARFHGDDRHALRQQRHRQRAVLVEKALLLKAGDHFLTVFHHLPECVGRLDVLDVQR